VRVVDSGGDFKAYHLLKGVVRSADKRTGSCELELVNSKVLVGVPENCLETVVSRECVRVEVVRGPLCGISAQLLTRDSKNNRARIRPDGGRSADAEVSLDDVCELA